MEKPLDFVAGGDSNHEESLKESIHAILSYNSDQDYGRERLHELETMVQSVISRAQGQMRNMLNMKNFKDQELYKACFVFSLMFFAKAKALIQDSNLSEFLIKAQNHPD